MNEIVMGLYEITWDTSVENVVLAGGWKAVFKYTENTIGKRKLLGFKYICPVSIGTDQIKKVIATASL